MKHILFYLAVAAMSAGFLFSSCDDQTQGTVYDLQGKDYVSFMSDTQLELINEETKVTVSLYHLNTSVSGTTATFSITYGDDSEGLFTVSATQVTFTNEAAAPIDVTFNPEDLEFNKDYTITFTITGGAEISPLPTAQPSIELTVRRALTFTSLGTGLFISKIFGSQWPQEVLLADQITLYRCPELYDTNKDIDFLLEEDGVTVSVAPQPAWVDPDYGTVYVRGSGTKEGQVIQVNLEHYVPGVGSFGVFAEELDLP